MTMTPEQREQFDRNGYLLIRGALSEAEVAHYGAALDQVYAAERAAARLPEGSAMHLLSAVANCPEAIGLIDHPATFPLVWSVLGWNVHIYHSHLDVHPPVRSPKPFRFEWHQDGGRQNVEIDGEPRPRISVKLAYWLSDLSVGGRGNLKVIPGSHLRNRIDGPPRRDIEWPDPDGAIELLAMPGDAVFLDRRLWHARGINYSAVTRKAIFFGYSPRWVAIRDQVDYRDRQGCSDAQNLVRRQLLGDPGLGLPSEALGDHRWGHYPLTTPLYSLLAERGQLQAGYPPLRPVAS